MILDSSHIFLSFFLSTKLFTFFFIFPLRFYQQHELPSLSNLSSQISINSCRNCSCFDVVVDGVVRLYSCDEMVRFVLQHKETETLKPLHAFMELLRCFISWWKNSMIYKLALGNLLPAVSITLQYTTKVLSRLNNWDWFILSHTFLECMLWTLPKVSC